MVAKSKPNLRCETSRIFRVLVGKPEGKRPLGRSRRRWEDNIKLEKCRHLQSSTEFGPRLIHCILLQQLDVCLYVCVRARVCVRACVGGSLERQGSRRDKCS
jgi:hypothetical protein